MVSKKTSVILLLSMTVLLVAIMFLLKPIPQPPEYHAFAYQKSWLGIPHALDVLSNILFGLAGLWGLVLLWRPGKIQFVDKRERWPWLGVSIGLILTAFGSAYYHLAPDNTRLVWDRLPMTIVFMSYAAALITERVNKSLGLWLWPLLVALGFYSVFLWHISELRGISDLRFYVGIQEFAILVSLIMLLTASPYTRTWDLAVVVALYGLARLCEISDQEIYRITGGIVSGHTLKHMAAALAGFWLIHMIWKRKMITNKI